MDLPQELKNSIEEIANTFPRSELLKTSKELTYKYKNKTGRGERLLRNDIDVLVYGIVRMPATYGAVSSVLNHVFELYKNEIHSVLDVGAGTGAGTWAVLEIFEEVENVTCIERESEMIELGKKLMKSEDFSSKVEWLNLNMLSIQSDRKFDLVIASYSLGELNKEERSIMVKKLWELTEKLLIIIEPGTPKAFSQIKNIREYLIKNGGTVVAPCPHSNKCPLPEDDWCHFSVRVSRNKLHKLLKGGQSPFEDEKYSYLAVSKQAFKNNKSRILRHPQINKGHVILKLCTSDSLENRTITKKNKQMFKKARKSKCGDSFDLIN